MATQSYVWWRDFLPPELVQMAQQTVIDKREHFVPTRVSTNEDGYRKSSVLWHWQFMELYQQFTDRISSFVPEVSRTLGLEFEPGNVECQMTISHGGDYFKQHNDNGTPDTETRRLTYVWYFLVSEHKKFTGGDLRLRIGDEDVFIPPNHNSIIWFPSGLWHEVLPVELQSDNWIDGRATLNGWVRIA